MTAGSAPRQRAIARAAVLCLVLLAGCAAQGERAGLIDVAERPAERALLYGMRAYDDAQYADAERLLAQALKTGLASAKDRAAAHKHLAFVYCSTARVRACEDAFRAARVTDPAFVLSRAEVGHPQWGPVYRRLFP
jgi:Tfp pilus assembly protein PilF